MEKDFKGAEFPDFQNDYHGHPNYMNTYIWLLILFGASLVVGFFTSPLVGVVLIFSTAVIKTAMVVGNFMHLKFEPWLILVLFAAVLFIVVSFYWGVFVDVTAIPLEIAK